MTFEKLVDLFIDATVDPPLQTRPQAAKRDKFTAKVLADRLGVERGAIRRLLMPCERRQVTRSFDIDFYSEEDAYEKLDELRAWECERGR